MSLSSGDEVPPHLYTKVASTARRIFDQQCKKTFATISATSGPTLGTVISHIHLHHLRLLPFAAVRDFFVAIACHVCYDSLDSKEYFQAQQAIDRAMTEALWRSNQLDVQNFRLPDTGEINLRLDGIASGYLESRETLRNQATSKPAQ